MRIRSAEVTSLVVALVMSLWLAAPAATAHDAPNYCGSQRKCSNQVCKEGESVRINEWPGFTCRYRQTGYEVVRVRCTARGDRVVHFKWGS
jgi:hypothetical protein